MIQVEIDIDHIQVLRGIFIGQTLGIASLIEGLIVRVGAGCDHFGHEHVRGYGPDVFEDGFVVGFG
jgi:hypothetical protein